MLEAGIKGTKEIMVTTHFQYSKQANAVINATI